MHLTFPHWFTCERMLKAPDRAASPAFVLRREAGRRGAPSGRLPTDAGSARSAGPPPAAAPAAPAGRLVARPRKDGKPAARAVRSGRERQTESGKRGRVQAYDPTAGAPYGRVVSSSPAKRRGYRSGIRGFRRSRSAPARRRGRSPADGQPGSRCSGVDDAAEPEVAGGAVDRLALAGGRT